MNFQEDIMSDILISKLLLTFSSNTLRTRMPCHKVQQFHAQIVDIGSFLSPFLDLFLMFAYMFYSLLLILITINFFIISHCYCISSFYPINSYQTITKRDNQPLCPTLPRVCYWAYWLFPQCELM